MKQTPPLPGHYGEKKYTVQQQSNNSSTTVQQQSNNSPKTVSLLTKQIALPVCVFQLSQHSANPVTVPVTICVTQVNGCHCFHRYVACLMVAGQHCTQYECHTVDFFRNYSYFIGKKEVGRK